MPTATMPRDADTCHGAVARRPHIHRAAIAFRRATGCASPKTAARHLDSWFAKAIEVVAAYRESGAMADLNKRLALFDAARRDDLLTAEDHGTATLVHVRANAGELVAMLEFERDPSQANRVKLIAALKHDLIATADLLATTTDGGQ